MRVVAKDDVNTSSLVVDSENALLPWWYRTGGGIGFVDTQGKPQGGRGRKETEGDGGSDSMTAASNGWTHLLFFIQAPKEVVGRGEHGEGGAGKEGMKREQVEDKAGGEEGEEEKKVDKEEGGEVRMGETSEQDLEEVVLRRRESGSLASKVENKVDVIMDKDHQSLTN